MKIIAFIYLSDIYIYKPELFIFDISKEDCITTLHEYTK
jgi:hypothetical protein